MSVKALVERAILDYEAKVGAFMSSGRELYDLRERARAYSGAGQPLVKSKAVAVHDKVSGLLTEFQSIHSSALDAAKRAGDLKYRMDSDPQWRAMLTASWSHLGYETLKRARQMVSEASGVASELATVNSRINRHLKALESARADVNQLDDYAQGKGVSAHVDQLFGFSGSALRAIAVAGVVAAAVVYLGPAGLARARR